MGVVDEHHEIGDRELQLVHHNFPASSRGASPGARRVEQNVGGLGDDELAGLEEGRRERRMLDAGAVGEASSSPARALAARRATST